MKKLIGLLFLVSMVFVLTFIPAWAADNDTLVVGVSSDIHTLDPGVSSDNYDWRQIYPCYDRLVKYKIQDGKGLTEVEPMAAESWTVPRTARSGPSRFARASSLTMAHRSMPKPCGSPLTAP